LEKTVRESYISAPPADGFTGSSRPRVIQHHER
jgi:hypothetical protein